MKSQGGAKKRSGKICSWPVEGAAKERDRTMDTVAAYDGFCEQPVPEGEGAGARTEEKRSVLERYVYALNSFDVETMVSLLHPKVEYTCIQDGAVKLRASGIDEFRRLAEKGSALFSSRKQTIVEFHEKGDQAILEISYAGVLAVDLSERLNTGDTLLLEGISEILFRGGRIYRITDIFSSLQTLKRSQKNTPRGVRGK